MSGRKYGKKPRDLVDAAVLRRVRDQRDRYKRALEQIANPPSPAASMSEAGRTARLIAQDALQGPAA